MTKKQACTPSEIADAIRIHTIYSKTTIKEMCNTLHIALNTVSRIGRGDYPRIDTLLKIADFLGCTVNDLVYKD